MKSNAFRPLPIEPIKRVAMRPHEAAAACGVSQRTLASWMTLDGFPKLKINGTVLIPTADLQRWLSDRLPTEANESEGTV